MKSPLQTAGRLLCALLLWPAVSLYSADSSAFGSVGHQQLCQLAYQLVRPETRLQIDLLMQQAPTADETSQPPSFAAACSWPDDARNDPQFSFSKMHHFINVAREARLIRRGDCAPQGCLFSALEHHAALLKQSQVPTRQRAEALLFFSHFVGDLHQPLHVSYADDQGGNKTAVYYFKQPNNLHGIWDRALLQSLGYPKKAEELLNKIRAVPHQKLSSWRQGDALIWAQQSLDQTRVIYRHYQPGMLFSTAELARDGPVVEQRLLQAGIRLAWLLDQLLVPPSGAQSAG